MTKLGIDEIVAVENLPSLPEVANRVLTLARDSDSDVAALAAAVKADPAMCAKVLRTANSAFFGRQFKVNSIQAAIPVLGTTLLRTLVLGFSLTRDEKWQRYEAAYRKIWQRTIHQAVAAEHLAARVPNADSNFYFACGLVQDVGSLAMLNAQCHEYSESILFKHGIHQLENAERKWAGYSHVEVSAVLCEKWKLAPDAIAAIRAHHEPLCLLHSQVRRTSKLTEALKLASYCAHYMETNSDEYAREFLASLQRVFDIERAETSAWIDRVRRRANELSSQFTDSRENLPALEEIIEKAKIAIEEVAIQGHLEAAKAMHQNCYLQEEIQRDALTGVGNRRALESALDAMIQNAISRTQPVGILFFDIDNFKPHNDLYGHDAGDEALKSFVAVLRGSLRDNDLIVRYGGDEFVAICVGPSLPGLDSIAERICTEFAKKFSVEETETTRKEQLASLTASVGGVHCAYATLADLNLAHAISEADQNMYRSKRAGGNRWSVSPFVPATSVTANAEIAAVS